MANILDYVDWRGDLTFFERGLNEVDNLIFSVLSYLEMDGLVPCAPDSAITIPELRVRYDAAGIDQSAMITDPSILLDRVSAAGRFKNVKLFGFENVIDEKSESQFSAVTFVLPDGKLFIAFRGTDDTIVGWKEDFNFSRHGATEGQRMAARYADRIADVTDAPIYIGGHSKGGNFAVYAAAFCGERAKERLVRTFSNDGPGFTPDVTGTQAYRDALQKVEVILPDSSLVGMLLSNKKEKIIIRSSEKGIGQHHAYSWQVKGDRFVRADRRSDTGAFMDRTLIEWVDRLTDEQKASLSAAVFDSLDASGAKTLSELNSNRRVTYNAVAKAALNIDPEISRSVTEILKNLASLSRDVLWDDVRKRFDTNIQ